MKYDRHCKPQDVSRESRLRMQKLAPIVIIFVMLVGCLDAFEVENLDPLITSIDPVYNDDGKLRINFTLNDFEGDDTAVVFEICEANETKCGFGELDKALTDPLARLHTVPQENERDPQYCLGFFMWTN